MPKKTESLRRVQFTIVWVFFANVAVAAAKVYWGRGIGSLAMEADGYHSAADALANIVGFVGVSAAHRPADVGHPYGHRKFETFAALGVAFLVIETAWSVLGQATARISAAEASSPTLASVAMMVLALAINIAVTTFEGRAGKKYGSDFLIADAAHTMSDVWVSLGVLAGLGLGIAGWSRLDPLVAFGVAGVIGWVGVTLVLRALPVLVDAEAIPASRLEPIVLAVEGVESCHKIRSRGRPDDIQIDLHIQVEPTLSVHAAHALAHRVKTRILEEVQHVTDVTIHVEPARRPSNE